MYVIDLDSVILASIKAISPETVQGVCSDQPGECPVRRARACDTGPNCTLVALVASTIFTSSCHTVVVDGGEAISVPTSCSAPKILFHRHLYFVQVGTCLILF